MPSSVVPLWDRQLNPSYLGLRAPVSFLDIDLPHSHWKIKTNDDLEGNPHTLPRPLHRNLTNTLKSKIATARNANSESEVDDSMLNLGLFSYPVLQAADVLVYRSAMAHLLHGPSSCVTQGYSRSRGRRPNATFGALQRPSRTIQSQVP